jgi:Fe-S cluster biogenesis protein NfuA
MDSAIDSVVGEFRTILKVDGGTLDVVSEDDGVVRLHYVPGHNEKCPECVLTPEGRVGRILLRYSSVRLRAQ